MPGAKLYGPNVRVPPAHPLPTCQVFYTDTHLKNTVIATEWFSQDSALGSFDSMFYVSSGVVLLKRSQVHSGKYGSKVQVLDTTRNLIIKFTRW